MKGFNVLSKILLVLLVFSNILWFGIAMAKNPQTIEKPVEILKEIYKEVQVEKIIYKEIPADFSTVYVDRFVNYCVPNVPLTLGKLKNHINLSKPANNFTENFSTSSHSTEYVEKIIYLPGTNTIVYIEKVEYITILPEDNKKLPCNRGGLPEECDPGRSANKGNFPFEKENYNRPQR